MPAISCLVVALTSARTSACWDHLHSRCVICGVYGTTGRQKDHWTHADEKAHDTRTKKRRLHTPPKHAGPRPQRSTAQMLLAVDSNIAQHSANNITHRHNTQPVYNLPYTDHCPLFLSSHSVPGLCLSLAALVLLNVDGALVLLLTALLLAGCGGVETQRHNKSEVRATTRQRCAALRDHCADRP